jgi:uncharacterized protein (TIGR02391 family)
MARTLTEVFPDAAALLALQPEELGDVILELAQADGSGPVLFSMPWAIEPVESLNNPQWPQHLRRRLRLAVAEAFGWLEHAGLIMRDPDQGESYRTLTRRGAQLQNRRLAAEYRAAAILPAGLLHPEVLEKAHAAFMRGDHDIAVFAAFKAIEVSVRDACRFSDGELGVPLMRKAFHPETGPLTDKSVVASEREATASLFAGAIGAAKNPTSHREYEMTKVEAARLLLFASYLMSIVEARHCLIAQSTSKV